MTHALFEVLKGNYAGVEAGEDFEAVLRPAHLRAINRGDIRLVKEVVPGLQPGSYTFPQGWLTSERGK